jgi:hypothetical protein
MWIDIFPVNVHPTAMEKPKKEGALYVHQKKSKKKTYFCEDCGVGLLCGALLLNLPQPAVAI